MPVAILERDEARTANACERNRERNVSRLPTKQKSGRKTQSSRTGDGLGTGGASLREQLAETFRTVRLLVAAREALAGQRHLAVRAREALAVPRFVLVRYTAACDDLMRMGKKGGNNPAL